MKIEDREKGRNTTFWCVCVYGVNPKWDYFAMRAHEYVAFTLNFTYYYSAYKQSARCDCKF